MRESRAKSASWVAKEDAGGVLEVSQVLMVEADSGQGAAAPGLARLPTQTLCVPTRLRAVAGWPAGRPPGSSCLVLEVRVSASPSDHGCFCFPRSLEVGPDALT